MDGDTSALKAGESKLRPPANNQGLLIFGAEDGIRTRDLLLGKEMLYH